MIIEYTLDDFDKLYHTSCESFYGSQWNRFERNNSSYEKIELDPGRKYIMYWLSQHEKLTALLTMKVLSAKGFEAHMLWDMYNSPNPDWCIMTDYRSKSWRLQDEMNDAQTR